MWMAHGSLSAQKTLSIRNKKTIGLYNQGRNLLAEGQLKQARVSLEKALDREPRFIEAMLLLADLFHAQEEYELEVGILKRSLQVALVRASLRYLSALNQNH